MKSLTLGLALAAVMATPSLSAEPIVGKWRAPDGGIVSVQPCGSAFCATVITGRHKGTSVGRMSGSNGEYTGEVTDPREDRTYSGSASVNGGTLELTGCALKIFCKSQTWVRI